MCNSVLPNQIYFYFYSVSRYEQWDGSPVQTRNRNPRPGQYSGSQQQFFKHSRKRRKKQNKQKKTRPRRNVSEEKKEIKYSSKEILIRLYFISSISSASLHVSLSAVSNRVFLSAVSNRVFLSAVSNHSLSHSVNL